MSRASYPKRACSVCTAEISQGGLGYSSHMKTHLRAGEVVASTYTNATGSYRRVDYDRPNEEEKPVLQRCIAIRDRIYTALEHGITLEQMGVGQFREKKEVMDILARNLRDIAVRDARDLEDDPKRRKALRTRLWSESVVNWGARVEKNLAKQGVKWETTSEGLVMTFPTKDQPNAQ